jgi:hypothetical protein
MNNAVINAESGGPDLELHEGQSNSKKSAGESASFLCSSFSSDLLYWTLTLLTCRRAVWCVCVCR